jgi:hypothetical protein
MERPVYLLPLATSLFIVGVATLSRFASGVRSVEAVGLSGGGFAIGVGFWMLVSVLTSKIGSRPGRETRGSESERRS